MMDEKVMVEDRLTCGLLNWYPWEKGATIKFIGTCSEVFKQDILHRGVVEGTEPPYDYIVAYRAIEEAKCPDKLLCQLREELKFTGHLLIACENRMGLQYFAGDHDPYTDRVLDGVENYPNWTEKDLDTMEGRCYARYEIESFLQKAGIEGYQGYSVLPGLLMPQQIYRWDYLPEETLSIRYTPLFYQPHTVVMNTVGVYDSLVKNGMFHQMANAYLLDYSPRAKYNKVRHVTTSMDRGTGHATATLIMEDDVVYKFALYPQGNANIENLLQNTSELERGGIGVVPLVQCTVGAYKDKKLLGVSMPYIKAPTAMQYLRELFHTDQAQFIVQMEKFLDILMASSEQETEDTDGDLAPYYKRTYMDLVPLNCFYKNGHYIFFDQEFAEDNYPIKVVLMRAIDIVYMGDKRMQELVPISYFTKKYGLDEKLNVYRAMGNTYIEELRHREELISYHHAHMVDATEINVNRQRMNYSIQEFNNLFVDILKDTKNKKIYLFGSGLWAKKFLAEYDGILSVEAILDNDATKIGKRVDEIEIYPPEILETVDPDTYKVFICLKQYSAVLKQVKQMGAKHYALYDPNIDRPDIRKVVVKDDNKVATKKYHLGYVAGVFDLFHVGHLHILRRAKEQCDILLVGVVSDEQASVGKLHAPFVGQTERLEIVQGCKYVDQAFLLPMAASGTRDVFNKYHFDVQFSGSDYEHEATWLIEQAWLRERGADMVFFPYTQTTSSTKLKKAINETLGDRG